MENCIFCKIAKGEIPCSNILEDTNFIAFLDINPIAKGMTLVIPKEHQTSKVFENDSKDVSELMSFSKKVSKLLQDYLNTERVALIFEGIEINHLHAKLIPINHGTNIKEVLNSMYPKPSVEELNDLALEITKLSNK